MGQLLFEPLAVGDVAEVDDYRLDVRIGEHVAGLDLELQRNSGVGEELRQRGVGPIRISRRDQAKPVRADYLVRGPAEDPLAGGAGPHDDAVRVEQADGV